MARAYRNLYAIIEFWEEEPYGLIFKMCETYEEAKETIERMKIYDKKFKTDYRKYSIQEYEMV